MIEWLSYLILIILAIYELVQIGSIRKGILKNIVFGILLITVYLVGITFSIFVFLWPAIVILILLFDLFYDEESFLLQWRWLVSFGVGTFLLLLFFQIAHFFLFEFNMLTVLLLLLAEQFLYILLVIYRSESMKQAIKNPATILSAFGFLLLMIYEVTVSYSHRNSMVIFEGLFYFAVLEVTWYRFRKSFDRSTKNFQQNLMLNQYEEIKNIYLDMRGWRHDYHNHIQTMKAYLTLSQIEELEEYLRHLDEELTKVDSYIKSGNLLVDAILNSKFSIAETSDIKITCTATVPEELRLSDVDVCIILGNLLDNVIESCKLIEAPKRFLRVYMVMFGEQLYISIQNSAKEELSFEERGYISTKRGNHGLGMKRVKLLIDKYGGFLNLANESGIFACEVTLPNELK